MRHKGRPGEEKTCEIPLPPRPPAWRLEVQDDEEGFTVPLVDGQALCVGSSRGADVVVTDGTVSGRHLEIGVHGDAAHVRDLGSRNGTWIGGARVREAWGGVGTVIVVGSSTIVVRPASSAADEADEEPLRGVVGASVAMRRVAAKVRRLAARKAPVLILGESGTGKELIARALHEEGPRRGEPFVPLNVTAMPRELAESELFGYERGAFTGAVGRKPGAFTVAGRGTLFLDEIGDLPLEVQPKLLRALDGYEIRRVGATGPGEPSDARVVAATNVALDAKVEAGQFRRDLYHRLEVFVVHVPPLRERGGDLCAISKRIVRSLGDGPRELTPGALSALSTCRWPGNVRELANVLTRAADLARAAPAIDAEHVMAATGRDPSDRAELTPSLARSILEAHRGNLSAASRVAGVPRTTFRKLIGRA